MFFITEISPVPGVKYALHHCLGTVAGDGQKATRVCSSSSSKRMVKSAEHTDSTKTRTVKSAEQTDSSRRRSTHGRQPTSQQRSDVQVNNVSRRQVGETADDESRYYEQSVAPILNEMTGYGESSHGKTLVQYDASNEVIYV